MRFSKWLPSGAVIPALILLACAGAGTASATELYSGGTTLSAGTQITLTLKGGTSTALRTTGGETLGTCTGSEMIVKTSNTGSSTETVKGAASKFTMTGCLVVVAELGDVEFHSLAGKNAQITTKGFRIAWSVSLLGSEATCTYSGGTGTSVGTLIGSTAESATVDINAVLSKVEGSILCPSDANWLATYVVTSPKPFHATPS